MFRRSLAGIYQALLRYLIAPVAVLQWDNLLLHVGQPQKFVTTAVLQLHSEKEWA